MTETYPNLVPRSFTLKKMGGAEGSLDPKTQPFPVYSTLIIVKELSSLTPRGHHYTGDSCKDTIGFLPAFYRPYLREWLNIQ